MSDSHVAPTLQEIERVRLFDGIDAGQLSPLLQKCQVLRLAADEFLLRSGEINDKLYIVLSGCLRVQLAGVSSLPLAIIEPGGCVGEFSVIDGESVTADVVAEEPSRLLAIADEVFWELVEQSPRWNRNLIRLLAERFRNENRFLLEYEHRSTIDPLTGLYNRRWLEDVLPRQIQRCRFDGAPLMLMMLDIDHFKRFNDSYGHQAGDQALYAIARCLQERLRPEDMVARYGGEEMTAILPESDRGSGAQAAERLRQAVAQTAIVLADGRRLPPLTISIGVAQMGLNCTARNLIARADEALYRAKRAGRNQVVVADDA